MFKYKYIAITLLAFHITHAHAVHSARKIAPRKAKVGLTVNINGGLKRLLSNEHKYLRPAIKQFNEAVTLGEPEFDCVNAIRYMKKYPKKDFEAIFRSEADSACLFQHKPFIAQLIRDSEDIERKYYNVPDAALKDRLYNDLDSAINLIQDPNSQQRLSSKVAKSKLQIEHTIQQNHALRLKKGPLQPEKITPEMARYQKVALMKFINTRLSISESNRIGHEDDCSNDMEGTISFAKLHNMAVLCKQEDFNEYNMNQLTAITAQPITIKTAKQYAVNNESFFKELIRTIKMTNLDDLYDKTEDAVNSLPNKQLSDHLYECALDYLGIDVRD